MTDHAEDTRAFSGIAMWSGIMLAVWAILLTVFVFRAPTDADGCRKHLADARTAIDSAVARSHSLADGRTCAEVVR